MLCVYKWLLLFTLTANSFRYSNCEVACTEYDPLYMQGGSDGGISGGYCENTASSLEYDGYAIGYDTVLLSNNYYIVASKHYTDGNLNLRNIILSVYDSNGSLILADEFITDTNYDEDPQIHKIGTTDDRFIVVWKNKVSLYAMQFELVFSDNVVDDDDNEQLEYISQYGCVNGNLLVNDAYGHLFQFMSSAVTNSQNNNSFLVTANIEYICHHEIYFNVFDVSDKDQYDMVFSFEYQDKIESDNELNQTITDIFMDCFYNEENDEIECAITAKYNYYHYRLLFYAISVGDADDEDDGDDDYSVSLLNNVYISSCQTMIVKSKQVDNIFVTLHNIDYAYNNFITIFNQSGNNVTTVTMYQETEYAYEDIYLFVNPNLNENYIFIVDQDRFADDWGTQTLPVLFVFEYSQQEDKNSYQINEIISSFIVYNSRDTMYIDFFDSSSNSNDDYNNDSNVLFVMTYQMDDPAPSEGRKFITISYNISSDDLNFIDENNNGSYLLICKNASIYNAATNNNIVNKYSDLNLYVNIVGSGCNEKSTLDTATIIIIVVVALVVIIGVIFGVIKARQNRNKFGSDLQATA